MIDEEKTDLAPTQSPETPAAPASQEGTDAAPKKHHYVAEGFKNRTKGEAAFNIGTYIGIGYFGSLAATVLLTWFLRDSKHGWPAYQRINDGIAHALKGKNAAEPSQALRKTVDSNMTILSMFTGTTLMAVFPIKWIEDRKATIVKWLDKKFYGDDAVENDAQLKAAHAEIENSPKQSWGSIGMSRLLAFGATLATSLAIGSNESPLAKSTGHSIDSISIQAGRRLDRFINKKKPEVGKYIDDVIKHSPKEIARADFPPDRITSRILNYLTLDGLYTVMTTSLLYVFTRVFAPVFDKNVQQLKREEQHQRQYHSTETATGREEIEASAEPAPRITGVAREGRLAESPERVATV